MGKITKEKEQESQRGGHRIPESCVLFVFCNLLFPNCLLPEPQVMAGVGGGSGRGAWVALPLVHQQGKGPWCPDSSTAYRGPWAGAGPPGSGADAQHGSGASGCNVRNLRTPV